MKIYTIIKNSREKNQRGVTLLMTLMIMAALTTIVFSMSAIAINELNNTNTEINSEPAIAGAEAGAEMMMYQDNRGSFSCSTTNNSFSLPNNNVTVTYANSLYYNGAYPFSLAPSGGSGNNQLVIYLDNPCDPTSTTDQYTAITVTATSGVSTTVDVCSWNNPSCTTTPNVTKTFSSGTSGSISLASITEPPPISTNSYEYQVYIINNDTVNSDSCTISTSSSTPGVTGVPVQQVVISTLGTNNGVSRRIQTILPR